MKDLVIKISSLEEKVVLATVEFDSNPTKKMSRYLAAQHKKLYKLYVKAYKANIISYTKLMSLIVNKYNISEVR